MTRWQREFSKAVKDAYHKWKTNGKKGRWSKARAKAIQDAARKYKRKK